MAFNVGMKNNDKDDITEHICKMISTEKCCSLQCFMSHNCKMQIVLGGYNQNQGGNIKPCTALVKSSTFLSSFVHKQTMTQKKQLLSTDVTKAATRLHIQTS